MPGQDLTGQVFGRLTALSRAPNKGRRSAWRCRCECGTEKDVRTEDLRSGNTSSCGCTYRESRRTIRLKHGAAKRGAMDPVYRVWSTMKERCLNPNNHKHPEYGARGIRVCDRWANSFEAFRDDMGPRPAGHSIERKNNNGDYEPGNCIWASRSAQQSNRRNSILVEHDGRTISAMEYARLQGISSKRLYKVMSTKGLSPEDACEYVKAHRRPA